MRKSKTTADLGIRRHLNPIHPVSDSFPGLSPEEAEFINNLTKVCSIYETMEFTVSALLRRINEMSIDQALDFFKSTMAACSLMRHLTAATVPSDAIADAALAHTATIAKEAADRIERINKGAPAPSSPSPSPKAAA